MDLEVEVADGVMVRGRAGREGADAAINFDADEAMGQKKPPRENEVRTEVVIPVEGGPGSSGVQHAETDHELGIQGGRGNVN